MVRTMITPRAVPDTRPLYLRIAVTLRAEIERGEPEPGYLLPSISDLCARFKASQLTVRRALGLLEDDGMIRIQQGIGTWVLERKLDELDPLREEVGRIRDLALSLIERIDIIRQNRVHLEGRHG
jgi:DNA-binding GntR family transcriptional regulator